MSARKPTTPEAHAGIFQSYGEIPARYRLETYTHRYEGDDTIDDYLEQVYFNGKSPVTESMRQRANRFRDSWVEHMQARDRHHALATPIDVETWCQALLENRSVATCYRTYFYRVFNFYDYLKTNYHHPHLYNPFLLAAIQYDNTHEIWSYRIKERPTTD